MSRKYDQRKDLLDHLISIFEKLDDDDFNYVIKNIIESRKMNTCLQIKHNDIFIYFLNLPDHQIFNASALLQTMTYPQGDHKREIIFIYLQKRQLKNKNLNQHLKRLKSSRSLSVQVRPVQFQQEVNKLFRANNNKYNAKFVKLATDISTIGRTLIRATVEYTKAIYQFLTAAVFETCQQKEIDPQKYHFWLTDNTAYMSSEANGAIAKFNSLTASKSFRIPLDFENFHVSLCAEIESALNGLLNG
ncbi:6399_t:CDS:2 [Racocetra persica]|uniref:6399_t:CDS:1 n=1 Tax=Racocetra persica TaxID=160502 RepID=A0ACA9KYE6_9GLOM|nr:6399_t:CDS:2 [Racocetra persica]